MERRIAALRKAGTLVEYHKFGNLGHGFGLGTGTSAQGWWPTPSASGRDHEARELRPRTSASSRRQPAGGPRPVRPGVEQDQVSAAEYPSHEQGRPGAALVRGATRPISRPTREASSPDPDVAHRAREVVAQVPSRVIHLASKRARRARSLLRRQWPLMLLPRRGRSPGSRPPRRPETRPVRARAATASGRRECSGPARRA